MSTDRPEIPSPDDRAWITRELDRMDAHQARRGGRRRVDRVEAVRQQLAVQRSNLQNLATATGEHMRDVERDLRRELATERAARIELERDVRSLRDQLDIARRLDRLEGAAPRQEPADAPAPRAHAGKLELIA